jgi:hypothetical protein
LKLKYDEPHLNIAYNFNLRHYTTLWIILGHTMMMPTPINGFDNPEDLVAHWGARGSAWFQLVLGRA